MIQVINTLTPVFFLILLGYFFKRVSFPSSSFWPMVDRLTYYVLMPSLLIYKLSVAKVDLSGTKEIIYVAVLSIFLLFLILLILNYFTKFKGESLTSIVQGAIRFNVYVFLAFIDVLYGDKGLVIVSILMAFVIPFINILSISTFAIYLRDKNFSLKNFLVSILKNPLIIACLVGLAINFSEIHMPMIMLNSLSILSNAALPMGLLSVGFGFEFRYIRYAKTELFIAVFAKLILLSLIIYYFAYLFGLSRESLSILIIFGSMPTAVSSYILARELRGDTKLMASIITLQTLLCSVVLFFIIPLAKL